MKDLLSLINDGKSINPASRGTQPRNEGLNTARTKERSRTMKRIIFLAVAICLGVMLTAGMQPSTVQAKTKFVTIGTGGITGVYYPTGGAISKIINKNGRNTGFAARLNPPEDLFLM